MRTRVAIIITLALVTAGASTTWQGASAQQQAAPAAGAGGQSATQLADGRWLLLGGESAAGAGSTRNAAQIERERNFCLRYLNTDGREIHWDFIRAALGSVANTTLVPLQDVLGLGADGRMNLPNSTQGNWSWRFRSGALTAELIGRLRELTELSGRLG